MATKHTISVCWCLTLAGLLAAGCSDDGAAGNEPPPDDGIDPPKRLVADIPAPDRPFAFWGDAPPVDERLAIFDAFWKDMTDNYGAFVSAHVSWNDMHVSLRSEVEKATTYGELYRLMHSVFLNVRDAHNAMWSERVCSTATHDRPPLAWVGPRMGAEQLGICVTALDDDTALVYDALEDNPAGLERGDLILGYDGKSLRNIAGELTTMPLCGAHATHPDTYDREMVEAAAVNFHLHEGMDVKRAATKQVDWISTDELFLYDAEGTLCTGQLDVGVTKPWSDWDQVGSTDPVSWGRLPGTNVGYVYVYAWIGGANGLFAQAIDELWDTEALILDFRFNLGGNMFLSFPALRKLYDENIEGLFHVGARLQGAALDALTILSEPYEVTVDPTTYYDHPIAVLVGPQAGAAGDIVPLYVANHPRARRFGLPTMGSACFSAFGMIWDPDPFLGDLTYYRTPCVGLDADLNPISQGAVDPEQPQWLTPFDVLDGRDSVVDSALRWIGNMNM